MLPVGGAAPRLFALGGKNLRSATDNNQLFEFSYPRVVFWRVLALLPAVFSCVPYETRYTTMNKHAFGSDLRVGQNSFESRNGVKILKLFHENCPVLRSLASSAVAGATGP